MGATLFDLNPIQWVVVGFGALVIGISKTGLPGVGIVAIPLFAGVLPARASTGVVLPMLLVADVVAVAWYRHHAAWPHLWRLLPWAVAGVLLGYLALGRMNDRQIRPVIGVIVLAILGLNLLRPRVPWLEQQMPRRWWFAAGLGLLAGVTTMLANAAGPIMILYLLAMELPKTAFIGTAAWYFLIMNAFKVPLSAHLGLIHAESLLFNLRLVPLVLAGAGLGLLIVRRIPQKLFETAMQLLAAAGAVHLFL